MSEYIGSRISLISKSDIKYIGTLHEINSETHTVALESVTSYGTEGRKGNPAEEIPGSQQVYEYIVFRGSDVKELTIVSAPGEAKENRAPPKVPDDPAILGSARPPPPNQPQPQQQPNQQQFRGPQPPYPPQQQFGYQGPPPPNQFQNQPRFQGPGGPHGFPGSPGAVPGYGYPPPPPGYGMPFNGPPPPGHEFPGPPPPAQFNQGQQMPIGPPGQQMNQQRPPQQMPGQQQAPIGSNKGTPQPQGSRAPPPPQQEQSKPIEMSATPGPTSDSPAGPPPPVESKPSLAAATAPTTAAQTQRQPANPAQKAANARVAIPLPSPNIPGQRQPQKPAQPVAATNAPAPAGQPQDFADATQAATAAVAAAMAKLGPVTQNQGRPQADATTDNLAQKVNQMRLQDNQQRGRGGSRGRGGAPRGGRRESAQKALDVPKEDYDFESANAMFNKQDLVKEAIASGSPVMSPAANGESTDPMASTNGHVNGADRAEDVVIPPSAGDKGYDKKSSFFDNISSDLKDRTEQQGGSVDGRAMRAQERTKNMDTFGQSNVDGGYRGGYRGRGRGHSSNYRGRGSFPRGGGGRVYDNAPRGGRGGYRGNRGDDSGPPPVAAPQFV